MEPGLIIDRQYLFVTNAHQEKVFQINTFSPPSTDTLFTTSTTVEGRARACLEKSISDEEQLHAPFTCLLSASTTHEESDNTFSVGDVFKASASYINGQPTCVITTKDLTSAERKRLSVASDRILDLSVVLTDRISHTEWRAQRSTQLRFTADVFVATGELVLTKSQPFKTVDVFGSNSQLSSLKVHFFIGIKLICMLRLSKVSKNLSKYQAYPEPEKA